MRQKERDKEERAVTAYTVCDMRNMGSLRRDQEKEEALLCR